MDSAIRREYGGTGLGLSIVKGIIDMHGGTINVESELLCPKFSKFTILLPLTENSNYPLNSPKIQK